MQINFKDTKNIKVGDWVESAYVKGYFKVSDIKQSYRGGKDIGFILLLKKAFTPTMKFSFSTEKCHIAWCEKLSESKVSEIERLLNGNAAKKKKFDEMPALFPCIQELYFLDIKIEQIESFREKLKGLQRYFTKEQFNNFVKLTGLAKYIKSDSPDPKKAITLSIYTEEWIVDSKKNMLFCNPQIGNLWGTFAKLDAEKWSDF